MLACSPWGMAPKQEHSGLFNFMLGKRFWLSKYPHTLRACYNPPTFQRNINASNRLIMTLQLIFELESIARASIKLDPDVSCNCQRLFVGGEGVIGDRIMEELVNLGSGHCECIELIGGALYYQCDLLG